MRFLELQLVMPLTAVYRPATDTSEAREIRRRAYRDRDAGIKPKDWPENERNGWMDDPKGHREMLRLYDVARHPDRISAPPPWPVEIALLATGALISLGSYDESMSLRAWRMAASRAPLWELYRKARQQAGRRRARRLGLTAATAPEQRISSRLGASMLILLVWLLRRHREPPRSEWELWVACQLVSTLHERRSYNAALKRS